MKWITWVLVAMCVCQAAFAQAAGDTAAASADTVAAAAAHGSPVPVPVPDEKAMRYYRSGIVIWLVGLIWGLAVPALLLFTGFSAKLRDLARHLGKYWVLTVALYYVFFAIVTTLMALPLDYYADFVRQHAYGLSNQTHLKFFKDWTISLGIDCIVGALFLWIPFALLRKFPRSWWAITSVLAVPFIILQLLVTPLFISPLFNTFGPMKDKALEAKILHIADRSGIQGGRVYEVEKSEDTKTVNAYVTGFAGTKRIVLWDTLLQKLDERQVLFVMAHEMGHYVLNHVAKSILFFVVLITVALYTVHRLSGAIIRRFEGRIGFSELSDPAALPLIMLVVGVLGLFLTPVAMAYSRNHEHEADRFALEITHDNYAGASSFATLAEENLSNPRPHWFIRLMRGSHPTLGERIDFCNSYRPWETGEPLVYGDRFRPE